MYSMLPCAVHHVESLPGLHARVCVMLGANVSTCILIGHSATADLVLQMQEVPSSVPGIARLGWERPLPAILHSWHGQS